MNKMLTVIAGAVVAGILSFGAAVPASAAYNAPNLDVQRILDDTNAARASNGLAPVALDQQMTTTAQNWSATQAREGRMYHNPNYSTQIPAGWSRAGENVAMGYSSAAVTTAWMNSPGHRANILGDFTHIGIGVVNGYSTQVFAKYRVAPVSNNPAPPAPVGAVVNSGDFSVSSHVQNMGWINGGGTTGQGLRLEALKLSQNQSDKTLCARVHVQNIGWMSQQCTSGPGTSINVGTTGQGLRMEALELWSPQANVSADGHVQNIGWQGKRTSAQAGGKVTVGTTGSGLRMEAVSLFN